METFSIKITNSNLNSWYKENVGDCFRGVITDPFYKNCYCFAEQLKNPFYTENGNPTRLLIRKDHAQQVNENLFCLPYPTNSGFLVINNFYTSPKLQTSHQKWQRRP